LSVYNTATFIKLSGGVILSYNIADYINILAGFEPAQTFVGKGTKSQNPPFASVLNKYMPDIGASTAEKVRANAVVKQKMLSQLSERFRAESEAKRQELLAKLLQKDDKKKPYDIFAKCLSIARRIMRGEKVSAEEMRLLAQHFPKLLFQALLLRQEDNDNEESDEEEVDEEGKFHVNSSAVKVVGGAASKPVAPAVPVANSAAD